MKIDVILPPGADAATASRVAALAEQYGLRGIWASNFPAQRDPFMTLMPAALATRRVRLGVMPYSPYEKHPVKLADSLLTLHDASAGRAMMLVGGLGKSAMRAMGLEPARRVTAVRECVAILRGCASGEAFSQRGELYQAGHYHAPWAPQPGPLLYVAANGPQMLDLAGECADAVMLSDIVEPHLPEVMQQIGAGCARAGRSLSALPVSNFFAWHIKRDRAAALAEARIELVWRGALLRWHISPYLEPDEIAFVEQHWNLFFEAFIRRDPALAGVPQSIVTKLIDGLTFTGDASDVERIAARLRTLEGLGQTEVALRLFEDPEEGVRGIGEWLLPALA